VDANRDVLMAEPRRASETAYVRGPTLVGGATRAPERFLSRLRAVLVRLHGLFRALGYGRIERPVAVVEKAVKGLLFDCRMCGQCVLSCDRHVLPDELSEVVAQRSCGGVTRRRPLRGQAGYEVASGVEAYRGAERIPGGIASMAAIQFAVDQRSQGPLLLAAGCARKERILGRRARRPGRREAQHHEVRGRTGPGLSAADSSGPHLAGALRARAARRQLRSHDELAPRIPQNPEDVY